MTAEEYWEGPTRLARCYREAWKIRQDNRHWSMWEQGWYFSEALLHCAPAFREMSKGREHEYPSEPVGLSKAADEAARERRERRVLEEQRRKFETMVSAFNRRFEAGGGAKT